MKSFRLPAEIIASRKECREPARVVRELFEERPVDVVADTDAEDLRIARALLDELQNRLAFTLLGEAVAEDHDIQRAIGIRVFVGRGDRRVQHRLGAQIRAD